MLRVGSGKGNKETEESENRSCAEQLKELVKFLPGEEKTKGNYNNKNNFSQACCFWLDFVYINLSNPSQGPRIGNYFLFPCHPVTNITGVYALFIVRLSFVIGRWYLCSSQWWWLTVFIYRLSTKKFAKQFTEKNQTMKDVCCTQVSERPTHDGLAVCNSWG